MSNQLDLPAERALFEGQVQGLVISCYQNERPPCGLAGVMDWHLHGEISRVLAAGAITGEEGEVAYLPVTRNGTTFHILLAGAGHSSKPGERAHLPSETLQKLQKNLVALKLNRIAVSKSDLGDISSDFIARHLKGASLWVVP